MSSVPYRVVVPSRARPHNVASMLRLFPTAMICVDESEQAAYEVETPPAQLLLHPPLPTIGAIRAWIRAHVVEEAVVMADDDVRQLVCLVGRTVRTTRDAGAIAQVIENGLTLAHDLGLSLVSWTRIADPKFFYGFNPFNFVAPACGVLGLLGRTVHFDPRLANGEDIDLTMQALLQDRIALQDRRFYFDLGAVYTGAGGLQGVRTTASRDRDLDVLRRRWKGHLVIGSRRGWVAGVQSRTDQTRVVVTRQNPTVSKR